MTEEATRHDIVWRRSAVVERFVRETRAGVPFGVEQIGILLRLLASGPEPRCFLDLGCGSGPVAASILDRFPRAQGVLLDFSEPMLDAARQRFGATTTRVEIATADLASPTWKQALPSDSRFDAVVSAYAIHHLSHRRKRELYGEIHALLEPGAWFVNIEHVASPTPFVESLSDQLFVDSLFAAQPPSAPRKAREEVATAYHQRPDKVANILAPVDEQCAWLREIGFTDVDCFFKVFELAVFGGRRALAAKAV